MTIEQQLAEHMTATAERIDDAGDFALVASEIHRRGAYRTRVVAVAAVLLVALSVAAVWQETTRGETVQVASRRPDGRAQPFVEPLEHRPTGPIEVLLTRVDGGVEWELFAFPSSFGPCVGARPVDPARWWQHPFTEFPPGSFDCVGRPSGADRVSLTVATAAADAAGRGVEGFGVDVVLPGPGETVLAGADRASQSPLPVITPRFDRTLRVALVPPEPGSGVRWVTHGDTETISQSGAASTLGSRVGSVVVGTREAEPIAVSVTLGGATCVVVSHAVAGDLSCATTGLHADLITVGGEVGVVGIAPPDAATASVGRGARAVVTPTFGCATGLDACAFGVFGPFATAPDVVTAHGPDGRVVGRATVDVHR